MTSSPGWGAARRIGFRFGFVFGVLLIFPFPLYLIPKTGWLTAALGKPFEWGSHWFAEVVLGLPAAPQFNGSGDRSTDYAQVLFYVIVAVLGAIVWSIADRHRRSYARLAAAAWVVLRYNLAYAMLSYGFAKILKSQFPDLGPGALHQRLGDGSPMRLLWAFMGYSTPYTVFAGLAEAIGGVLLLWRRTALLGALLVIAVMTNVVLLNFCYDVCVKIYSIQLLITAVLIALPGARRLVAAVMGRAVGEVPPRVRMPRQRERIRVAGKLTVLAMLAIGVYFDRSTTPSRNDHVHELYGNWTVQSFFADGVEHPPLTTDAVRWQTWSAGPRSTAIWLMNDQRDRPPEENRGYYVLAVDATHHTITLTLDGDEVEDEAKRRKETWTYTRPTPGQLVIDGVHRGKYLHTTLRREPDPLLLTRGFHWINEVPFNR